MPGPSGGLNCNFTGPKTRVEQWAWLVSDAQRILRSPLTHREEEVAWARDVVVSEERIALKGLR